MTLHLRTLYAARARYWAVVVDAIQWRERMVSAADKTADTLEREMYLELAHYAGTIAQTNMRAHNRINLAIQTVVQR